MGRSKFDAELDPERDLKGATPETLARALLLSKGRLKGASRVRERQDDGYEQNLGDEQAPNSNET